MPVLIAFLSAALKPGSVPQNPQFWANLGVWRQIHLSSWSFSPALNPNIFSVVLEGSRSEKFRFDGRFWPWEMDFSGAQGCQDTWTLSQAVNKNHIFLSLISPGYDGRRHLPPGTGGISGRTAPKVARREKSLQGRCKMAFIAL